MLVIKMAVRNLFRYKRRTIITSLAIAIGLLFYISIDSLLLGWYGSTEEQYIDYEVASGRIVKKSWWEDKDRLLLSQSIENTGEITSLLDNLGIDYTPRTEFKADLIFYKDPFPEDGVYPARVVAIDPGQDGLEMLLPINCTLRWAIPSGSSFPESRATRRFWTPG